ncbi:regulator of nonsense transcripts 3A-like [Agrilus planipennis]|uniref:Regulator of nonsense transcripts 3A-like n=1 Tax=Agrilus planipennis TaxID=224129 RepID=A0A1W4WUN6_AGRPL|nr:regulator of nonsense transcripts 3A-like [Agrilus planipennis]
MSDNITFGNSLQKNFNKMKEKKVRPLTKVVIRRLPPDIDKGTFMEQISPVPNFDYFYLIKADSLLGEFAFSRAYINFINVEDIFIFKEKFDSYVFIDQKGHEYAAVVEFAAFQKIPKKRRARPDPKCATIESDPYYKEFLLSLSEQPKPEEKPEYSYQFSSENKEDLMTTPLLEYVKQKKVDKQRIREERRDERRKREIERKKFKEDEKKKYLEEKYKPGAKSYSSRGSKSFVYGHKTNEPEIVEEEETHLRKGESNTDDPKLFYKNNRRNFNHDKVKPNGHYESKDFKYRKEDYKDYSRERNFGNVKKMSKYETKQNVDSEKNYPKKVKKYSAIKEERRNEIKKHVQKKSELKHDDIKNTNEEIEQEIFENLESQESTSVETTESPTDKNEIKLTHNKNNQVSKDPLQHWELKEKELKTTNKENDPRTQRRIRNKDRPSMAIYQPGMLSKRKQEGSVTETTNQNIENKPSDKV